MNMDNIWPLVTTYAIRIVGVIALFGVAWYLAGRVGGMIEKGLKKASFDATLSRFLSNVARWLIIIMALLACLGVFGIETTSFAALIGAAGLANGLGFQGSLSNVAAGIMLLIFRPFRVGDVISVGGNSGKVDELSLFTTHLDTPDNRRIIVPNSVIFGATLENVTHHPTRRVDVNVGCSYDAELDATRAALEGAVKQIAKMNAEPAPQVVLVSLGDSAVNWTVLVWCQTPDYFTVLESAVGAVKRALDGAKISIPYPQMDVHLSQKS